MSHSLLPRVFAGLLLGTVVVGPALAGPASIAPDTALPSAGAVIEQVEARQPVAAKPLQVLFVGNSYTFYNDMPKIVQQMSIDAAQPRPLAVKDVTWGGASLEAHWHKGDVQQALASQHWDYVVIQDFSTMPVEHPETTRKYVRLVSDAARNSGAQPILYMTWAREYDPAMQAQLDSVYTELANATHSLLAPVGKAWMEALADAHKPDLYIQDGSHPTYSGSYLAASVFYSLIYGAQPPAPSIALASRFEQADVVGLQRHAWNSLQALDVALRSVPSQVQATR
ncbi:SGNH/GDSL hydrolase family protein [Pseudomonas sp. LRF_L74]|uniref:SGNH/GDSL hydrolase family protein n=1 Tax=Pseudomonas sp. LRF_L74 TaxID=3369422 RepID=UPI003F601EA6